MIIEQQQVDRKFGEFVLVLKERKFSFTSRRSVKSSEKNVYFSRLITRRCFIKSPAGIHAYPPVLLDFEGDPDDSSRRSASSKCNLFARLGIFYKFFVIVNVFSSSK
jgi:hypothetical protein